MKNPRIAELEELFDNENSMFLFNQPAVRSVFRKIAVILAEQDNRIRDLEKRNEDTEG